MTVNVCFGIMVKTHTAYILIISVFVIYYILRKGAPFFKRGIIVERKAGGAMTYKEKIAVRRLEIKKQLESNKKNWQDILDKHRTERDSIASYVVPVIEENHKDWGLRYADDLKRMIADKGCDPTKQELLRFRSFFTDRAVHSEAIQYSVRALIGEKRNVSAAGTNYYGAIDASTFKPETTGLYIFRRNVSETAAGSACIACRIGDGLCGLGTAERSVCE